MRKLTRFVLWLFIFSVPWGIMDSVAGVASITRFLGIAAIGLGLVTSALEGRIRWPGPIFWLGLAFAMSSRLSLLWTVSVPLTSQQASTDLQLIGIIWLLVQFVRTRDEHESMMLAFWLGASIVALDLFWNFSSRPEVTRYTATNFNPNYVGFALAMGFPMAWRQFSTRRGAVRIAAAVFCMVAPVALLLTASRSAIIAGVIALSIVPLTLRRPSKSLIPIATMVLAAAVTVSFVVPQRVWDRVLTTKSEIEAGTLGGRGEIWNAGWQVFQQRPILGSGTGAYPAAVGPLLRVALPGHNMSLTLLVEQGIVGFCLFFTFLAVCAWTIFRLPSADRKLWLVVMLGWATMTMAHDSHRDKLTWVLFGLLAAQHGVSMVRSRAFEQEPTPAHGVVGETLIPEPRGI